MLYAKTRAVFFKIHSKHVNAVCRRNVEFLIIEPGGAQSNDGALQD
jgi:hypothetical protein